VGHNPGGFRYWWRRLHDDCDEQLDSTHLMRMAGRLARRVKARANAAGVPLIYCKAGERKHLIAEEYLEAHPVQPGVFMILAAKASASVREVSRPDTGVLRNLAKRRVLVSHYSFHIMDPARGHLVILKWPNFCWGVGGGVGNVVSVLWDEISHHRGIGLRRPAAQYRMRVNVRCAKR
jgi:hypothetical protein